MSTEKPQLAKSLTVTHAVGLALSIVVGSGLLVLPGLAYRQAGAAAIYAWLLDLAIVIPLLAVFAQLGARWPGAGGIAGFLQNAFSRRFAAASEVLLIGTFGLGIPAIALTGGQYLAALFGVESLATAGAVFLLLLAAAVNWRGAGVSGGVQRMLAFSLCAILFAAALAALLFGDRQAGAPFAPPFAAQTWRDALPAAGLVFFAFTGWEMLAFTAEEYKNPKRDFPLAVAASFVVVAVLYLLAAAAAQLTLPRDDPQTAAAPVAEMFARVAGIGGGRAIAAAAVAIVVANLIGATWAASRLVFSSAREGLLPHFLSRLDARKTPRAAVGFCFLLFVFAVCLRAAGWLEIDDMLRLAGQNFFLLYALSVAAYLRIARTWASKTTGAISALIAVAMTGVFGPEMIYPVILLVIGWIAHSKARTE